MAAVVSISGDEASRLVKIVLSEPNVFFLESLSQIMIVPEGSPNPIVQPTGTGPYRLDAYERGTIVRLKAFQDYWQGTPKEPRAEFLIIPSADKATDLLLSGEVDLVRQLPPRLVGRVEAKDELWVESRLSQTVVYLQLNPGIAPFDDPLLRQAIDLAVDREALVHKVTLNHSRPASQMLTPSLFGFNPSLKPTVRDLDRARKLLAQTQLKKPVSITIQTTDAYLRTGRAIEAQLEEAGFNVELVDRPWPELYSDLMQGTVAAWLGFWGFDSSDASVFFNMVVHSRSEDGYLGSVNLTSVENDPLDATIRAAAVEPDLEKRRTKLEEIARLATEQKIRIPLLWPLDLYGTRRDFDWQARKDRALLVTEMNRGR